MAIKIDWSEEARADIRALDRTTAMFIFEGLLRYVQAGHGDVKALSGEFAGRLRLRIGDYRILFSPIARRSPYSRRPESKRRLPLKTLSFQC
jgi:mRNA-degrading endonuclease RelE of RelBE toxin-antitoxin system